MIHNRSAKKYIRRVRSMLPCSRKNKNNIMEQIRRELDLFLEDHPTADYAAIVSRFGEPETIAAAYVEGMGTAELLKRLRIRKRILCAVAIVLAFIVITWVATVSWSIYKFEDTNNGHGVISVS